MSEIREWGEENGSNGACARCGKKTWVEFGCAPLCMGCDYDEPEEPEEPEAPEDESAKIRDIGHEQVSESTDAELAERLLEIVKRSDYYNHDVLREHHTITSEMYCRSKGIRSEPWCTYCDLDPTAVSVIAAGRRWRRV